MTDNDDVQHRAYHQPTPDRVEVRQPDDEQGVFRVRMPIATTGEVRNQNDDPLSREELEGMAEQIEARRPSVFLDHGKNPDVAGSRYSATGVNGTWEAPEVRQRELDDEDELVVDARLMDPETLPDSTGALREALARVKAQAERDIPLRSSIGWRDDDAAPGGVDLMEASLVGIPADPRTSTDDAALAQARAVVMGPVDDRHVSEQQAEMATQVLNVYRDQQGNGSVENFEGWLWSAREQFDENQIHAARTVLQEFFRETTPLEEPVTEQLVPFLDERAGGEDTADSEENMADTESNQTGDQPDDTNDGQDDMDAQEYRESMLEMQRQQTETLSTLADAIANETDGEQANGDDEDDDEDDEDDEQAADTEETQSITVGDEELTADDVREMREQLNTARDEGDVETPETDADEADADGGERDAEDSETDTYDKYGLKEGL